jgi:hypothetical protein
MHCLALPPIGLDILNRILYSTLVVFSFVIRNVSSLTILRDINDHITQPVFVLAFVVLLANIAAAKAIKIAMLHHFPLMLLRAFAAPLPLCAVGLSVATQSGCASVRLQRGAPGVMSAIL